MKTSLLSPLRVVVCAYGEIGWTSLHTLLELGCEIPLVVTHEDDPDERCWFRSVRDLAREASIPTIAPNNVNAPEPSRRIAETGCEYLFSFYFRHLLRAPILGSPKRGALNLHGSLLPRYRGRAPVNWALIGGEVETGVTLHYMDAKPDHGDIVSQRPVRIERDDSALTLTRKLAAASAALLHEEVPRLAAGVATRTPQEHARATVFGGRRPVDGEIDWQLPAERIRNLIRAVTAPWPGAFTWLRSRKLMIWWAEIEPLGIQRPPGEVSLGSDGRPRVATGDGEIEITRLGWEGEEPTDGRDWVHREKLLAGERLRGRAT